MSDRSAVLASIDAKAPAYGDVALKIWSFAEVGYQETKSSALLQEQLKGAGLRREGGRRRDPDGVHGDLGVGQARDRHHRRVRRAARTVADRVTRSKGGGRRTVPVTAAATICSARRRRPPPSPSRSGSAADKRPGTLALLRHAGRRGRRRQGLHAPRRSLRRCGCRGHHAPGRSQRGERLEQPGEHHRQVSLPWRVGARRGRARSRTLRARRRRSDERHGQPDARARAVRRPHPLRDHQWRPGAERGAGFRRGVLLRASQRHARPRRDLGADQQRGERRRARHRDDRWSSR